MTTVCPACERELGASDGCHVDEIELASGLLAGRVRYGDEAYFSGVAGAERRCHDCDAELGQYHHASCDFEACPNCGGQALGCDCDQDVGGYACPTHGPSALGVHRLTPLRDDPEGLEPEGDTLEGIVTTCLGCHGELDAAAS